MHQSWIGAQFTELSQKFRGKFRERERFRERLRKIIAFFQDLFLCITESMVKLGSMLTKISYCTPLPIAEIF